MKKTINYIILIIFILTISPVHKVFSEEQKPCFLIISKHPQALLDELVKSKEAAGFQVKYINIGEIPHDDDLGPKDIRIFLKKNKDAWNIKYLLIVGTEDTVPMMYCSPASEGVVSRDLVDTPTDFYYSSIYDDWDKDDDGRVGEYPDDGIAEHKADIFVGRIPFDEPKTISEISKSMAEFDSLPDFQKAKMLFGGAMLGFQGEVWDDKIMERTDGGEYCEKIYSEIFSGKGFSRYRLYEKDGFLPSPFQCEEPLNAETFGYQIPNRYGLVLWTAHGSPEHIVRTVWNSGSAQKSSPSKADLSQPRLLNSTQMTGAKTRWGIVVSASCSTSNPSAGTGLGASVIKAGASAYVGSTRVAWSPSYWRKLEDGGMDTILYLFCRYLSVPGTSVGQAIAQARVEFAKQYFFGDIEDPIESAQMNIYNFNLYGDPSVCLIKGDIGGSVEILEPSISASPGEVAKWEANISGSDLTGNIFQVIPDKQDMSWAVPEVVIAGNKLVLTAEIPSSVPNGKRFWILHQKRGDLSSQIPIVLNIVPKPEASFGFSSGDGAIIPFSRVKSSLNLTQKTKYLEVTLKYDPDKIKFVSIGQPSKKSDVFSFFDNHFGLAYIRISGASEVLPLISFRVMKFVGKTSIDVSKIVAMTDRPEALAIQSKSFEIAIGEKELWISRADFDRSGKVDSFDLALLLSRIGCTKQDPKYDPVYDLDDNGLIDFIDYSLAFKRISG
ncbi:MAG TPA: C25 family cysteine peptidase [Caldisericia bacterium]|nr:C25 family cysteine peptidase [Caldisericia bacterium]